MKIIIIVCFICSNIVSSQNWMQIQVLKREFDQAVTYYNDGKYAVSITVLNKILSDAPGKYEEAILLLLLKSQIGLDQSNKAKETSRNFFLKFPESIYLVNIMESLGDLYINERTYQSAYRMYLRSRSLSQNSDYTGRIDSKLLKLIQMNLPESLIDELLILELSEELRNIHLLAKANSAILNGSPDEAAIALNQIDPISLPDTYSLLYENLLRRSYEPSSPVLMVGIVLPLSGAKAKEGEAFLSGFYEGEKSNLVSNRRLSILALDSRSSNLQVIIEARNLEKMNQVKTLISPLNEQSSIAIVSAMSKSDIPIILSKTQENDLTDLYKNTYHFNSTLATEGRMAARYAVNSLGLKYLGVIAPASLEGEIQADAFIKEVDRLGANLVVSEWYSGEPKNIKRQFKNIRKVAFDLIPKEGTYDEALGMSIDSLDALFDISTDDYFDLPINTKKKMSSSDSSKVVLSSIQGLYIPINSSDLEYIAPQIPMYNLETKVIGNKNWQNLFILQKENIGPHLKGLSIITNFYQELVDTVNYKSEEYFSFYNGYNIAKLLIEIDIENQSRLAINKSLQNIIFFKGEGTYYSPSIFNNNINAGFQILEFDGSKFNHQGVFIGDSLQMNLSNNR